MVNAALIGTEIASLLPERETPAKTSGYEGFFHLCSFEGNVTSATLTYIIRDFDKETFEYRKNLLRLLVERKNIQYPKKAMQDCGVTPIVQPIRGGPDGARLSFMGLPCPNIFAGGHNFHSTHEFIPIPSMEKASEVIVRIAQLGAELKHW